MSYLTKFIMLSSVIKIHALKITSVLVIFFEILKPVFFRFFHASFNNHCVLNTVKLISTSDELSRFVETILENDFLENFSRPNTRWIYLSTTNITFYVNKLEKTPIRQSRTLPDFFLHNQGINSLMADVCETPYRDHLCFFVV